MEGIEGKYAMGDIEEFPHVLSTRGVYKKLGKSSSQYRNVSEDMLRQIIKGNSLYQINNVVEINNLILVTTGQSIGSYDVE